jgi:hypothetical protein
VRAPVEVEDHVVHFVVLAIDLVVVVDGLHAGGAAIGVVVQRLLELALLGGELLDDLLGGVAGGEMSMRPKPESSAMGVKLSLPCARPPERTPQNQRIHHRFRTLVSPSSLESAQKS